MNETQYLTILLIPTIALLIVISQIFKIIKRNVVGKVGERRIVRYLKQTGVKGYILTNLYIPYRKSLTEVDAVFISKKGIFVIESKNYKGRIYGDVNKRSWIQILQANNRYYFYNPIKQNASHTKAISKILNIPDARFKPIVIFGNQARLNVNSKCVINVKDLTNYIKSQPTTIYNKKKLKEIYKTLKPYKKVSLRDKIKHRKHVNMKKRQNNR